MKSKIQRGTVLLLLFGILQNTKAGQDSLPKMVSIIDLIANGQKYDGKKVFVKGFIVVEFEGNAIYLSRDDCEQGNTKNGIWLAFSKDSLDGKSVQDFNRSYGGLFGTFDTKNYGHLGLFSGTLKGIDRAIVNRKPNRNLDDLTQDSKQKNKSVKK